MKHETTTLMTKKAMAASLKKFMKVKPLDKITVSEIVEDCGVNRKTFYYHFTDIYALVKWMFEEEAIDVVKKFDVIIDYNDAMRFIMNYVDENKYICNCAINSLGRDELKRFFQNDFCSITRNIVDQLSEGMVVPEDYKEFLVKFYTDALAALLIDWIQNKEDIDREKVIKYFSITLYSAIKQALENAEKEL